MIEIRAGFKASFPFKSLLRYCESNRESEGIRTSFWVHTFTLLIHVDGECFISAFLSVVRSYLMIFQYAG